MRYRMRWAARRGAALDDVVMATGLTIMAAAFTVGALELWGAVHTRQVLQQAGQIVDRSLVASGCFTTGAQAELDQFLKQNGLNPQLTYVHATTAFQPYGSRTLSATLGYDVNVAVPFANWQIAKFYTQVSVPADQSLAVAGDGAGQTGCAGSLAGTFTGVADYGSGTGSGSSGSGVAVTQLTVSASPNPVVTGGVVTLSGTADVGSNPAPAGTAVTLQLPTGPVQVTTTSQGTFSDTWTAPAPGQYTLTATAGLAQAQTALTVQAATAAQITVQAPSTVVVGQPFTIGATVTDASGNPVANGTPVTITSTDPTDIPTQTAATQNGTVSFAVPHGITQAVSSVTVTLTAGPAQAQATLAVQPGDPTSVTLAAQPTTLVAGQAVTFSGQVWGPDQTPPAAGTPVTITSATDTADPLPTAATNAAGQYSASAPLTVAGSQTFTALVPSGTGTVTSAPVTVTVQPGPPAAAEHVAATPDPVAQGVPVTVTGIIVDAYGNPVAPGTPVTVSGPGLAQPVSGQTGPDGQMSLTVTFTAAGQQTLTVSAAGAPVGTVGVTVWPTGALTLTPTPGSEAITAGGTATFTWTLTDAQGQPVPGATLTFSATPAVPSLPASCTTDAQGQCPVTLGPLTQAGSVTVTATDAAAPNVQGSAAVIVAPDAAHPVLLGLAFTPSVAQSTQTGGTVLPVFSGTVTDPYGNPLPNTPVAVQGGWDPGVVTTGTTAGNGTFALAVNPVVIGGPYPPTVTVGTGPGALTATPSTPTLTVVPQVYQLTLVPANGSTSVPGGTPYGVVATLTQYGNTPAQGVPITFTATGDAQTTWAAAPGTPTPSGPASVTVTTNAQGQAEAVAAFEPNTGSVQITATVGGGAPVAATLAVTVTPNTPSQVLWTAATGSGGANADQAGQPVTFTTQGLDAAGFGLTSGQTGTWAFDGLSGSVTTAVGVAGVGTMAWTATPTRAGSVTPTVTLDGQTFTGPPLTVEPGPVQVVEPALNVAGGQWNAATATMTYGTLSTAQPSLQLTAYDAYGNVVPNWSQATVACTATQGGPCPALTQPSWPTNSQGQTAWTPEGPFAAGTYHLTVTPGGSDVVGTPTMSTLVFQVASPLTGLSGLIATGNTTTGLSIWNGSTWATNQASAKTGGSVVDVYAYPNGGVFVWPSCGDQGAFYPATGTWLNAGFTCGSTERMAVGPDGSVVIANGAYAGTVWTWSPTTQQWTNLGGQCTVNVVVDCWTPNALAAGPNGLVADISDSASGFGVFAYTPSAGWQELTPLSTSPGGFAFVALSADGHWLAYSPGNAPALLNLATHQIQALPWSASSQGSPIYAAFGPQDQLVVVGTVGSVFTTYEWTGTQWTPLGAPYQGAVDSLAINAAGQILEGTDTSPIVWTGSSWAAVPAGPGSSGPAAWVSLPPAAASVQAVTWNTTSGTLTSSVIWDPTTAPWTNEGAGPANPPGPVVAHALGTYWSDNPSTGAVWSWQGGRWVSDAATTAAFTFPASSSTPSCVVSAAGAAAGTWLMNGNPSALYLLGWRIANTSSGGQCVQFVQIQRTASGVATGNSTELPALSGTFESFVGASNLSSQGAAAVSFQEWYQSAFGSWFQGLYVFVFPSGSPSAPWMEPFMPMVGVTTTLPLGTYVPPGGTGSGLQVRLSLHTLSGSLASGYTIQFGISVVNTATSQTIWSETGPRVFATTAVPVSAVPTFQADAGAGTAWFAGGFNSASAPNALVDSADNQAVLTASTGTLLDVSTVAPAALVSGFGVGGLSAYNVATGQETYPPSGAGGAAALLTVSGTTGAVAGGSPSPASPPPPPPPPTRGFIP